MNNDLVDVLALTYAGQRYTDRIAAENVPMKRGRVQGSANEMQGGTTIVIAQINFRHVARI